MSVCHLLVLCSSRGRLLAFAMFIYVSQYATRVQLLARPDAECRFSACVADRHWTLTRRRKA